MLFQCFDSADAICNRRYHKQWLATFTVNLLAFSHGIGLGWASPMLHKLQSPELSPLSFVLTVQEASWVGALVSAGGATGTFLYGSLLNRIGRKNTLYVLAIPHMCYLTLLYTATSAEFLYAARLCGGTTGGGIWFVLPMFISEIADNKIRGRLTSLFVLSMNTGTTIGFILSIHLEYHLFPCVVIVLPILYLLLVSRFPETPSFLLRRGAEKSAEESLKFYTNFKATSKSELEAFNAHYNELRTAIEQQQMTSNKVSFRDYLNKRALTSLISGIVLVAIYVGSGIFAILNYMTIMFARVQRAEDTSMTTDPNTNTIIIGIVQIIGTYTATILVDRFGRKVLLIVSTTGMGIALAAFGVYAFFAEETFVDLSQYSSWLPLLLMGVIVFIGNVGISSVTSVTLVEIMPVNIRSQASSLCLILLSCFAFIMLKLFPVAMHAVGLAATVWFCACVCAFGLFYIAVFIPETKGKSMHTDANGH